MERAVAVAAAAGPELPGVDMRVEAQLARLTGWVDAYRELRLPHAPGRARFHYDNTWFTYADAIGYALLLRDLRPRRVVEVGAGYSSALALDVADRYLDPAPQFAFIDPDPVRLTELLAPEDLAGRLVASAVQDVPFDLFQELAAGDVLFVDSSHVLKAGSDVQFLFHEVLPVLPAGVHIHFHDVFHPFEYPAAWLRSGTALNEAYAVRALLSGGDRYRVVLATSYLIRFHADWLRQHMPLFLAGEFPTGGIWLEKTRA